MGLSNPERVRGIYYTISFMKEETKAFEQKTFSFMPSGVEEIIKIVNQLWVVALRAEKNSAHWILGSHSSNCVDSNPSDIWGATIHDHIQNVIQNKDNFYARFQETDNVFEDNLSIAGLLNCNNSCLGYIYRIFQLTESMIYYVRRYDDDLQKEYQNLDDNISNIRGVCFDIFKEHEEFAKAYLIHHTCELIYTDNYPYSPEKFDKVTKWLIDNYFHFHLSSAMSNDYQLSDIMKIHLTLENSKKTQFDRVMAILSLLGRRFTLSLETNFDKLISSSKTLKKHKKEIQDRIKWCKEKQKENEEENKSTFEPTNPTSVYSILDSKDLIEKL